MNDDIEKIIEEFDIKFPQVAMSDMQRAYMRNIKDFIRQALHQAQQSERQSILALRPENKEIGDEDWSEGYDTALDDWEDCIKARQ